MSRALQALDIGNYEYALPELKRVARADFELGRIYWHGQGLARDRKLGLKLMLSAADAGRLLSTHEIMMVACQSDAAGDFEFALVLLKRYL